MIWMLPVAGALAGAMLNKKRPLQGAMMGGLLGAGGAYAAPALMGASGAGAAGAAATAPGAAAATTPGLLSTFGTYSQPVIASMQAAQMAKGLLGGGPQAPMQAPQNNSAQGAQIMSELYKGGIQGMTPEQQMRMQRRQNMWG